MSDLSIRLVPSLPGWVILLLALGLIGLLVHGSLNLKRKQVPTRSIALLGGLRLAMILLFALLLLHPVISWTRDARRKPEMIVLLDVSESMAQAGGGSDSRLDEMVGALKERGIASELSKRFDLHFFALDEEAIRLEGDEWRQAKAEGKGTHYADGLTQAWNFTRAARTSVIGEAPPPERVLLIGDGQDRGKSNLIETARRLGVAVDVLAPGSPQKSADQAAITIADVQGARRVLLGSETQFLVTLRAESKQLERRVTVRMFEAGKELAKAEVALRAGRTEERVRLVHRPAEIGAKSYEFRVEASPPFPLSVQVLDGKHEVLVLEDTWRWEFKFLRRVLEEDPSYRFTALLSRGGGSFQQFAAPDRRSELIGLPQNRAQLALFDTVFVGDIDPRRWPRDLAASLRQQVSEEGKSVVVLAGPNLLHWVESPDLLALLPVEITRETANPVAGPVGVRVSTEGARSPFFSYPQGGQATRSLPALDQIYPPLRKKPAATVLLEADKLGNPFGPLIVMAEHTVGRGRVLYVGTDTLWKWQTLTTAGDQGTTPYHLFWQQSMRALTPLRAGTNGVNLWLTPQRSRHETGQRVSVRAEIDSRVLLNSAVIRGLVSLPNGRAYPLNFTADPTTPTAHVTEFETSVPGTYRLTASVFSEGRPAAEAATLLDVVPARPERDDAPVDLDNLTRIAGSTGGHVLNPDDPESWPTSANGPTTVRERVHLDLWNHLHLLILLTLVAGADWLIRMLRGYV